MLLGFGHDIVEFLASQHCPAWAFDELTGHLRPPVCDDTTTILHEDW